MNTIHTLRIVLRFLLQCAALAVIAVLEYPLGAPVLTVVLCSIWFFSQAWHHRLLMAIAISFMIAVLFSLSWFGVFIFLLCSFWFAEKSYRQGWPTVVIGVVVLFLALIFSAYRSAIVVIWQILLVLVVLLVVSPASRKQLGQVLLQKRLRL
ncbi:MAG: hypothetical protein GW946_00340 [Candidatus Pacebacteria bacterium]|nr:hypothetical protein [Candidatus Paceibacterota bacterium]